MRKFLLLIALVISGVGLINAQEEIVIGDGTSSGYYAPFNNYYKYSWNETIYQKADIGGGCTIKSISYHRAAGSSYSTQTIKIYMGETIRSSITSTNDWTPSNSLTLVYSGSNVTIGDSEWENFVLDTPFEYSGNNNLVVVVAKTAASYTNSLKWYYTSNTNSSYVSMYRQDGSSTSYAEHPSSNSGNRLTYAANIKLECESGADDDHEYVDLGLPSGLKWATCNIGAETPEEYGDWYAWGEITTKDTYNDANCSTLGVLLNDISGNPQYDAATANWGGDWRLPTKAEMEELINQCNWVWATQNGIDGYKVVSKTNDSYIFLPAAGYFYDSNLSGIGNLGNYWTSTPTDTYGGYPNAGAYGLDYYHGYSDSDYDDLYNFSRPGGLKVRPVSGGNFEGPTPQYASVTTSSVSEVTTTTSVCGGEVTSDNGFTVTAKGVCWSTSANPTIEDNKTVDGSGVGTFTSNISGLTPMTTYYVRAYATNAAGTKYGSQRSFTTAGPIEVGDVEVIKYGGYSLKFTVTSVVPAECEVVCPYIPNESTAITIPSSVAINGIECSVISIGDSAFEKCYNYLTGITIPSSVASIGNSAFEGCSSLKSVNIPNSVATIGNSAFKSCSGLTSINIPNGITSIGDYTFQSCSKLTSISIPNSVTSIGNYAFYYCGGLTNISIPNSVTSIGDYAFQDCYSVESIEIPSSVDEIGDWTFAYCSLLKNVEISNGVTTIGNSAFHNCSALTSVEIPNSVTSIGDAVFKYCYSLISATLPNSVTSIGASTFYNCDELTNVEIPNGVVSIEDYAFNGCSLLTNIEIPSSVTSIGNSAFSGCSSFTELEIPSSVTSIGSNAFSSSSSLKFIKCYAENVPTAGSGVFESCHSNMAIYVPSASLEAYQNTEPWSGYNVLPFGGVGDYIEIDYDTHILKYTVTNVEPKECEVVCKTKPTSEMAITIPSSVTIEGKEYNITSIGNSAFSGCSSLTSIEIPSSVISIGYNAFGYCSSLTNIEIPNSVTSIGTYAFISCSKLTNIYSYSTVPATLGNRPFDYISSYAKIYVPATSLEDYKSKWSSYSNYIVGMPTYTETGWTTEPTAEDNVAINHSLVIDGASRTNDILTVNTIGITEKGKLIIKNGGQLVANSVIGEVTVENSISGYGEELSWHTISSPLKAEVNLAAQDNGTNLLSGNYELYRYDEPTYTWQNYKNSVNNGFTSLESGRGYIYANSENVTMSFIGNANTDDVVYNLTNDADVLTGFHLIGNPFTHNITADNFTLDNATLASGYYVLSNEGDWGVRLANDGVIKPTQGALIKATITDKEKAATLTLNNNVSSQRTKANGQDSQYLSISVSNGKYSDKAIVLFGEGIGLDKINHQNENSPLLYIPMEVADYAVAVIDKNFKEIPVNFEANVMGEYTISLKQENCEFEDLYLFDKPSGMRVNILEEDYTFIASVNDDSDRFILTFANSQQPIANGNFAYISGEELIINAEGTIQIIDMMGRIIYNNEVESDNNRIDMSGFDKAAYIIRCINENGINVQKVIL